MLTILTAFLVGVLGNEFVRCNSWHHGWMELSWYAIYSALSMPTFKHVLLVSLHSTTNIYSSSMCLNCHSWQHLPFGQFNCSVMSHSLWPHGLQPTRPPWSLLKLMSIESVMLSNHLILCYPVSFLPSIFPVSRDFSSELALCIRWWKYWSFSISPSNEYSVLISFQID